MAAPPRTCAYGPTVVPAPTEESSTTECSTRLFAPMLAFRRVAPGPITAPVATDVAPYR